MGLDAALRRAAETNTTGGGMGACVGLRGAVCRTVCGTCWAFWVSVAIAGGRGKSGSRSPLRVAEGTLGLGHHCGWPRGL